MKIALQTEWLRVTQNPTLPNAYPRTGHAILLKGHNMLPDGQYLVTMVEQFEPPFSTDSLGVDIRFSLMGKGVREAGLDLVVRDYIAHGLNGRNVMDALTKIEMVLIKREPGGRYEGFVDWDCS